MLALVRLIADFGRVEDADFVEGNIDHVSQDKTTVKQQQDNKQITHFSAKDIDHAVFLQDPLLCLELADYHYNQYSQDNRNDNECSANELP